MSFDQPKVLVGNFIGDFVKGDLTKQFDSEIIVGIQLHRAIDRYTDLHPVVKESQKLLKPVFARYSSVITDMFFDYFLARNWQSYHIKPLEEYVQSVYQLLQSHAAIHPPKFRETFKYMQKENWLVAYGTTSGIQRALTGISYRTTFKSHMEKAPQYLEKHHNEFERYFKAFFPELIRFSEQRLRELRSQKP
nr:acyl carrier protein phosphodiesterase [Lunatimonas salinarum]